jgi:hypothetical protein
VSEISMSKTAAEFGVFDANRRRFYHGTKADLKPGDLLQPSNPSNYAERKSPWIYFSETLHAATGEQSWPGAKAGAGSMRWNRPASLWMTPI